MSHIPLSRMEFPPLDPSAASPEIERSRAGWQSHEATYFVTFRLSDSLALSEAAHWRSERERWFQRVGIADGKGVRNLPLERRDEYRRLFTRRLEEWLDAGSGECLLQDRLCAEAVEAALRHGEGDRYVLGPFVVMPNHVHALVQPQPGHTVAAILQEWKAIAAQRIGDVLERRGTIWAEEHVEHRVRDEDDLARFEQYILGNPHRAGLPAGAWLAGCGRAGAESPGEPAPGPVLTRLLVRDFRCFERREVELQPGLNFIVGPNAHGKTSLLEAACILLRLASPRVTRLAPAIQHGKRGFVVDGYLGPRHLQFYFSSARKKLALDSVEQKTAGEYLQLGRLMWFSNADIEITRGSGEVRRRFLDFVAAQMDPTYRGALRDYERALRARNLLLKSSTPRWREIAAFSAPLVASGERITAARQQLVAALQPRAQAAHATVSGGREVLRLAYLPGAGDDFAAALAAAEREDARLRQTTVGPHRDELAFYLNEVPAVDFASEGQQRTLVFALRLGAAHLLERHHGAAPLLLIDDIFGELDLARRHALLAALPERSQKVITTTHLDWLPDKTAASVLRLGSSES